MLNIKVLPRSNLTSFTFDCFQIIAKLPNWPIPTMWCITISVVARQIWHLVRNSQRRLSSSYSIRHIVLIAVIKTQWIHRGALNRANLAWMVVGHKVSSKLSKTNHKTFTYGIMKRLRIAVIGFTMKTRQTCSPWQSTIRKDLSRLMETFSDPK